MITDVTEVEFPKTYKKEVSEIFTIDADIIVPKEFVSNQFYKSSAHIVAPEKAKIIRRFRGLIRRNGDMVQGWINRLF